MFKRLVIVVSILLLASACAHIPESVNVDEGSMLTNFSDVRSNAEQHSGELARWGGVIAKVANNAENTMLEVVYFDLKASTRPVPKDQTQGRFRVYYQGFLDPVIYKEGRSITALGNIAANELDNIGEHEYAYPVLKASGIHLWKKIEKADVRITHQPLWHTPSLWYYPRSRFHAPIFYPVGDTAKPKNEATQSKSNK